MGENDLITMLAITIQLLRTGIDVLCAYIVCFSVVCDTLYHSAKRG